MYSSEELTPSDILLKEIEESYSIVREWTLEERKLYVNYKTESYFQEHEEFPNSKVLNKLSDLILYDYLEGDTRQNKNTLEEYSILSQSQYDRKVKGKTQARRVAYVEAPTPDFSIVRGETTYKLNIDFMDDIDREID